MRIVLNIGLGEPQHEDNVLTRPRRLKNAFAWLAENFRECYIEHAFGIGLEPALLVEGVLLDAEPEELHERLHELAVSVNQDCVAAVYGQKAYLVGPAAAKWGPFDPDKFRFPRRGVL